MARRRYTLTCQHCGKDFHPYHHDSKYCSRKCANTARDSRVTLTCASCGKSFKRYPSQVKGGRDYCSMRCKHRGVITLTCAVCGKRFERRVSRVVQSSKRHVCSAACCGKLLRKKKIVLSCAFCGKRIERYPSDVKKAQDRGYLFAYCSQSCRARMAASQFTRSYDVGSEPRRNPRRDTAKDRKWAKAVLERDRHTCQDCGATDCPLCAHHKRSYFYHPALRYDVDNGVTLCFDCHSARHSAKALRTSSGASSDNSTSTSKSPSPSSSPDGAS